MMMVSLQYATSGQCPRVSIQAIQSDSIARCKLTYYTTHSHIILSTIQCLTSHSVIVAAICLALTNQEDALFFCVSLFLRFILQQKHLLYICHHTHLYQFTSCFTQLCVLFPCPFYLCYFHPSYCVGIWDSAKPFSSSDQQQ